MDKRELRAIRKAHQRAETLRRREVRAIKYRPAEKLAA